MTKDRLKLLIRIVLTASVWLIAITYSHKLGHLYLSDIKAALGGPVTNVVAQIFGLSILLCAIWLSMPRLPKLTLPKVVMVFLWSSLLAIGHHLSHYGFHEVKDLLGAQTSMSQLALLLALGIVYLLVLALPFVPGLEIGLLIILTFGVIGALAAYVATVFGILLAFVAGRMLPMEMTSRWLSAGGLQYAALDPDAAMNKTLSDEKTPARSLWAYLLKYRYMMLAICLNLPGNSVLGGGGGIGLLCGMGRSFTWRKFTATLAVSVAPIPILASIGVLQLQPLLEKHGLLHEVLSFLESFLIH